MAVEIERRFLVKPEYWQELLASKQLEGKLIIQGYLCIEQHTVVRIRMIEDQAWITIKNKINELIRREYEYAIPQGDAQQIIQHMCGNQVIIKTRYKVCIDDTDCWEVDVFHGKNDGLIIAEHELDDPEQIFTCPIWIDQEITHDHRYDNMYLARHPFKYWSDGKDTDD
ncbi:MAG: CYTH domain-containing protein [Thermoflavifilum sp.]|nr:CYTH domain-containing protein [Thermoflavifilum sp.]